MNRNEIDLRLSIYDFNDIIKAIDAKVCYIFRSSNYKSKSFTILFFKNTNKLNDAIK